MSFENTDHQISTRKHQNFIRTIEHDFRQYRARPSCPPKHHTEKHGFFGKMVPFAPTTVTAETLTEEIKNNTTKYPPKSLMHKSANYFLNEWDGIEAIANYGDVDWDNNRLERINRYISLSRHNSLFFGSHEGAKRGCVFYLLACSCRNNGINFFDYLSDVLNKAAALPQGSPVEAYRNLLPDKWVKNEQGQ